MKILLSNPVNFCIHKLLIASRRKSADKNLKDLEQALHTSAILDDYEVKRLFHSLPEKWRQNILQAVKNAGTGLPLLNKESERLFLTLQSEEKH